jgi:LysM repeat protein
MNKKESPQSVIDTYKKRQQLLPTVMVILAVLLVIIGIIIIINWIGGSGGIVLFPTKTPTPTMTFTPTPTSPTPTPSMTPTITDTPVPTNTETPSGPMQYIVLEGDNCWAIAQKFNIEIDALLSANDFKNGACPIQPNQTIIIPAPGWTPPTLTPIPSNLPAGTLIDYPIQRGDTLYGIASQFNTTVEDIYNRNKALIPDQNNLAVGVILKIRVNMVTPTKTLAATSTRAGTLQPATATPTSTP